MDPVAYEQIAPDDVAERALLTKPVAARFAVTAIFFLNGFILSSWVPRIPAVKDALDLSEGRLGLALLGTAVGALMAMPVTGWLLPRVGSRVMTTLGVLLLAVFLVGLALANSWATLTLALGLFGAANGTLDVSMNAHGVVVERGYRRPILTSFHAAFSFGGLAGAAAGGVFAGMGVAPRTHFLIVTVVCAGAGFAVSRKLLPGDVDRRPRPAATDKRRDRRLFRPPGRIVIAGIVALACLLGEGAVADWSAVYLNESLGSSEGVAAVGFVAFSLTMAIVRLIGDRLAASWGPVLFVRGGGALVAAGLGLGLVIQQPWAAIAGFGAVGAGLAGIFPVVLSAAGRMEGLSTGAALAFVATLGYTGFLVGPPAIGLAAEVVGLKVALGIVVAMGLLIVVLAGSLATEERAVSGGDSRSEFDGGIEPGTAPTRTELE